MHAALDMTTQVNGPEWHDTLMKSLDRIAPSWPLDDMIAVNPLWGFRDLPMRKAVATASALGNISSLAPEALDTAAQALPMAEGNGTPTPTTSGVDAFAGRPGLAQGRAAGHQTATEIGLKGAVFLVFQGGSG